jgi:phytoene synthase
VVREGYRRARSLTRTHARSFSLAAWALPSPQRDAARALYAFCRRLDDLVDEPAPSLARRQPLVEARALVSAVHGTGALPDVGPPWDLTELAALRDTVRRWDIPEGPFHHLIVGVEMDLTERRYATFAALDLYCFRVAGTVGLMLAPVFGYTRPRALAAAADLGRAMQLTNILRDVREDFERGRVYLPQDELAAFGVTEDDLARGRMSGRMKRLLAWQIERARRYYAIGGAGIRLLRGVRARLTVRLMTALYADILRTIEDADYDVFRERAVVSGRRKAALVARCLAGRDA